MKKLLVASVLLLSGSAFAGDSGCGLGSVVISKNSKGLQLLSMTTNGSFSSQFFGITSGTSGCSSSGIVQNDREMQYFVEVNNDDLSREMAQGKGEKLQTLAVLNGCINTDAQVAFNTMAKNSYSKIYTSPTEKPEAVISNLHQEIKNNSAVQEMCQVAAL